MLKVPLSIAFVVALISVNALNAVDISASKYKDDTPSLLTADTIYYDEQDDRLTAEGNVVISQNGRSLYADRIIYYRKIDTIAAIGNVYLVEPSGEVIFVNYVEISDDLKKGFAQEVRMILSDDSKLAAARVIRSKGTQNEFERVVYSPCKVCKVDPSKPPLWQIKARHVLWNQEEQVIEHTDAFMEFLGVPVFYTPYLTHPDPTVKRKTGFLAPSFGGGSDMGTAISTPYFIVISPDKDMTLTPMLGTKTQILMGEYRQRFTKGILEFRGSGANVSNKRDKNEHSSHWHIDALGRYHANPNWRLGLDVARSSDRNYTKRYNRLGIHESSVLTSKVFAEGFYDRSFIHVQGLNFQGLRPEDRQKTIPTVAPLVDINYKSCPSWWDSWWTADFNSQALSRREGTSNRRVSLETGWHLPYQSFWGDSYLLDLTARADGYHIESYTPFGQSNSVNTYQGRVIPQASLHWWYPFVNQLKTTQILLTPMASFIASPNFGEKSKIPNEDCRIFELHDANLFDRNRQTGLDRLDSGTRVNYGGELAIYGFGAGPSTLFLGQSYNFHNPRTNLLDTGVHRGSSDYVMRVQILPIDYLRIRYKSRLQRRRLKSLRSELSVDVGPPILRGELDYISVAKPQNPFSDEQGGEQIFLGLSSNFVKYWTASIGTTRELGGGGGALSQHVGLKYQDECFAFITTLTKTFYRDQDIRPGITLWFTLEFKNLGAVSHSVSRGGTPIDDRKDKDTDVSP